MSDWPVQKACQLLHHSQTVQEQTIIYINNQKTSESNSRVFIITHRTLIVYSLRHQCSKTTADNSATKNVQDNYTTFMCLLSFNHDIQLNIVLIQKYLIKKTSRKAYETHLKNWSTCIICIIFTIHVVWKGSDIVITVLLGF